MTTLTFFVTEDGKLPIGIRTTLQRLIPNFAGKKCRLTIIEAKEKRSLDQNSYYRGVILPHVKNVMLEYGQGASLDCWHESLLATFSPEVEMITMDGEISSRAKRTHEMTVEEMAKFITAITADMANRKHPVPMLEDDYYNQGKVNKAPNNLLDKGQIIDSEYEEINNEGKLK